MANFLPIFPRKKIGLNFVTENFTTFFAARKEICHLELTLGASSPKYSAKKFGFPGFRGTYPDLLSLAFLEKGKENHQKKQRILILGEPPKSLEKKGEKG